MIVTLKTHGLQTLEQLRVFLAGTGPVDFQVATHQEAYELIRETLGRVPGACGYYFGTSLKPSVSSDPAGDKPSKSVFNSRLPRLACIYTH
jgi:hypothetical protein